MELWDSSAVLDRKKQATLKSIDGGQGRQWAAGMAGDAGGRVGTTRVCSFETFLHERGIGQGREDGGRAAVQQIV